jgi:general secretion pathway protein B
MSYILEALKKSQQERELGHVPTLETPTFLAEEEGPRPNPWILLAILLAVLAVVVAFYSVLRGSAPTLEQGAGVPEITRTEAPEQSSQDPDTPLQSLSEPPARRASTETGLQQPASTPLEQEPRQPEADSEVVRVAPADPVQPPLPIREAPGPAETTASSGQERSSKAPPDLVADIEAFKREVRREQSGTTDAASAESKIAAQDLRLPAEVRERLPEFVMSAHIYDKEPSKRFVLINGLKTREGEESREQITVEQILPEGAVLSFAGHRFFQRRR